MLIIPADLQEAEYTPPAHEFKQVPSSPPAHTRPRLVADGDSVARPAELLNAGSKVAILVGQGARGAAGEIGEVAEVTGGGVAKALLGKDVLSDDLPYVTGSIGLLGTRPSYELMRDCDTLLDVGSSFPCSQFLPEFGRARAVQIDTDPGLIGLRYAVEAKFAHPDRPVVALAGDGAIQMNGLAELMTVSRYHHLLDVHCDPEVPPIPPHATFDQLKSMGEAVLKGRPQRVAPAGPGGQDQTPRSPPVTRSAQPRPRGGPWATDVSPPRRVGRV